MRRHRFRRLLSWSSLSLLLLAAVPDRAAELRWRGLAELENERPAEAEATFTALARLAPDDPLPHADLAVALLRQQKGEAAIAEIDRALAKAPGRADILAIRGEALAWSGRTEEALSIFEQAAKAAPDDPEIQYSAYRQATARGAEEGARALAGRALARLAELRPENLVVLLQAGSRAIAAGDRAGATAAYLRVREVLWGPPPAAAQGLAQVLGALERADGAAARVPALR